MFSSEAVRGAVRPDLPILAIVGEHDHEPFREATVRAAFDRAEVAACAGAGHYPMQETPVALASLVGRFLSRIPA